MINFILILCLSAFASSDSKLVKAVHEGTNEEIKILAKNPAELNWKDRTGYDALFYAASLNESDKVKILLDAGANTKNLYADKKESILFEPSRLGSTEVLELLIKKDPSLLKVKNTENESPIFEAVREDQSQVVSYFVKKGMSLKEKNKAGKVPADYVDSKNKTMVALFKKLAK